VSVNNPLHGGQTDPGTGEFGCSMKTLESAEEPAGVGWIESSAIVANEIS